MESATSYVPVPASGCGGDSQGAFESSVSPDCLIWHFDHKGKFSVKSAYRVALALSTDLDPPSSSVSGMAQLWKWVWNAKLPKKIKLCTWRGIHDILPTCCALAKRRGSLPHLGCGVCGGAESTLHILRNYPFAQAVWCLLSGLLSFDRHADLPLPDWLLVFWCELPSDARALSMVVMWALWSNQNDVTWRSTRRRPHDLVQFVLQYMEEFRCANNQPTGCHDSLGASCWSCPPSGTIKINFVGAFHTGSTGGGVGVVIRDENGQFLASLAKRVLYANSAEHVECLAAREAVGFWRKMGGQSVIFEGDSLNTIQDVLSSGVNLSPLG
ncbi:uncharacterized protein LOC110757975 [Prunus avium]|uniref:Uncharacterized protein LOC110757975 n=1 Tax=Prunus avium TaxID=42229 RepID=A0A6P5SHD8_PRUAV|nr:uncharacterized protein LOC110757975 [Prunus avium]